MTGIASSRAAPRIAYPQTPRLPAISVETLALLASAFFTLVSNRAAWNQVLEDRLWSDPSTWWFAGCVLVALTAFQGVLLAMVLTRRNARYVLAVLFTASAAASYFIQTYNVYFDP